MYRNLSLEDIDGEVWKPVVGYENDYMVSNYGRVKSIFEKVVYNTEKISTHKPKIMKQYITYGGYLNVLLRNGKPGKTDNQKVHRLVGYAFLPIVDGATEINHKDFNRLNNCVENLEWCTRKKNVAHVIAHKRNKNYSYIDKEKVIELYKQGYTAKEIASSMGVTREVIASIVKCVVSRKEYSRKLKYIDIELLKSLIASGMRNIDIARKYNIPKSYISVKKTQIKRGEI